MQMQTGQRSLSSQDRKALNNFAEGGVWRQPEVGLQWGIRPGPARERQDARELGSKVPC